MRVLIVSSLGLPKSRHTGMHLASTRIVEHFANIVDVVPFEIGTIPTSVDQRQREYCLQFSAPYPWYADEEFLHDVAKQIQHQIDKVHPNAIIFTDTIALAAKLETDIPLYAWTDCTIEQVISDYNIPILPAARALGMQQEQIAISKYKRLFFYAPYSVQTTGKLYAVEPEHISTVCAGPGWQCDCMNSNPYTQKSLPDPSQLQLLFVGYDWARKGGELLLQTLSILCKHTKPQLTIIGSRPAIPETLKPFVTTGIFDVETEQGRRDMCTAYRNADIMVIPSLAENFGHVFCEAFAHGIPVVSTAVGGISFLVGQHTRGIALPKQSSAMQYAHAILSLCGNKKQYRSCSQQARHFYEQVANWNSATATIAQCMARDTGCELHVHHLPTAFSKVSQATARA